MMRTSPSRLKPDQRREQILAAAKRVLEADPHGDLSVELVAAEAGVSAALLFHYFGSKRTFQFAVIEAAAAEVMLRTAPDPGLAEADQLRAGIRAFVESVVEQPQLFRATLLMSAAGDEAVRALHSQMRRTFTSWVVEAVASIGVEPTPAVTLACYGWQGFVEQTLLTWLDDPTIDHAELLAMCEDSLGALLSTAVTDPAGRERLAALPSRSRR